MAALVIGYGNPLRQDDGAGRAVADAIEQSTNGPGVRVITVHQLTPELMLEFQGVSLVVFVDAAHGAPAGAVTSWELTPEPGDNREFTHHCEPGNLLYQADKLYNASPRGFMVTIAAAQFGFGEELSAAVREAVPRAVERVERLIGTAVNPPGHSPAREQAG